ncbi:hypothetical protein [Nocardioides sp.]|uniref:hypothetical protein n=1 Tax=Nocardioides sp. TaxID=35761 RepID=UPI0035AFBBDE
MLAVLAGTSPAQASGTGSIRGQLTSSTGADLSQVKVTAWTSVDGQIGGIAKETMVDGAGSYALQGMADGTYVVCFQDLAGLHASECWDDAPDALRGTPVAVANGAPTQVDARLTPPGKITGTVSYDSGRPASVKVWAYPLDGSMASMAGVDYSTGAYTLPPLRPGKYVVYFEDWTGSVVNEWSGDQLFRRNASVIDVPDDGTPVQVDARLAVAERIRGTITRIGRAPMFGEEMAAAYLEDPATGTWDEIGVFQLLSAQDGTYTIGGLPAGTYKIRFGDGPGGYTVDEYWLDQPTLAAATPIAMLAGGTQPTIDAEVVATSHLYGGVTLNGSQAVGTVDLLTKIDGTWTVADTVPLGAGSQTGIFEGDFVPGTYRLRYTVSGAAQPFFHPGVATVEAADDVVLGPGASSSVNAALTTAQAPQPPTPPVPTPVSTATPTPVPTTPAAPSRVTGRVALTGKPVVGNKLVARLSGVSPSSASATYAWYVGTRPIKGATAKSLKVTRKVAGKKVSVKVTLRATGLQKLVVTSRPLLIKG